jgi:alpha-mannosidase
MDDRIVTKKIQLLQGFAVEQRLPLTHWEARTARHLGPGHYDYLDDWHAVTTPVRFPAGATVFLRGEAAVPDDWPIDRVFLHFGFENLEGLLSVNGEPWSGVDAHHPRCPVPSGGRLELTLEFDSVPRVRCEPGLAAVTSLFADASLTLTDPEVEGALLDFRFTQEALAAVTDPRRKALISAALEEAMLAFSLTGPREQVVAEVRAARELLRSRLAAIEPDPGEGRICLTGHTHIDVAYLWPIKETLRKCARTFATACWMMDRFPQYRFACSQAQLYAFTKQLYPTLYERMRRYVAEGRWETTGAMWVEADCNVSSGEALIRQILHGLRFFREEFGTRPTVCWLPDVFGYNAGLPQILVGCGIRSFWTWKLHWQSRNPFPYHLFWWQGVDGSRVLAHIPKLGGGGYNGSPTPQQLVVARDTYLQRAQYDEQLFPFGYGDGGGGVSEEQMQYAVRACGDLAGHALAGLPACTVGLPEDYFAAVHEGAPDLPTWVGELYLETHRGTYTSQGRTKRANRQCEIALRNAEIAAVIASRLGVPVETHLLRNAWERMLCMQFHDILPGTSVTETYEEAREAYNEVLHVAHMVRAQAIQPIMGDVQDTLRFAVFNALSWERSGVVELDIPDMGSDLVGTMDGESVPVQVIAAGNDRLRVLVAVRKVPPMGGAVLEIQTGPPLPCDLRAGDRWLENPFFRLQLNEEGEISSLWDKRAGREAIAEGQTGNQLQLFQDGPEREAAWNVHPTSTRRRYPWDSTTVTLVESGPVRATLRVVKRRGQTVLTQDISLTCHLPLVEFRTRVNWQERQTMLKAAFPLAVHTERATYEIQFGAIERPTHTNTSWEQEKFEVCAQRWADLSEGGYGVSLLNDCKYGHDARGNVLRLTLLRGPQYPDPLADLGEHEFTYALYPHQGDWRQADTVRRGWELNVPMFTLPTDIQRPPTSFLQVQGPAIVEALKPAEDGEGAILRLYEPHGGRGRVTVTLFLPVKGVVACNLAEENQEAVPLENGAFSFDISPFQIRSFRLL